MSAISIDSLAALAMRLRQATEVTPIECMNVLRPLPHEIRERYVAYFEANPSSLLRDPIEFDPQYQELIEAIAGEAKSKLAAGELGDGRRGRSGRMWGWMKSELAHRHRISWRTPSEMSPWLVLD